MPSPAEWGVQPGGWVTPPREDVRAWVVELWGTHLGGNRRTDPHTTDGRIVDFFTEGFLEAMLIGEGEYASRHLGTATGASFLLWAISRGFTQKPAVPSTVEVTVGGVPGTVIPAGTQVEISGSGNRWTLPATVIPGFGEINVIATSVNTGPIPAAPGSGWTIVNPIAGFSGLSNSAAAVLGRDLETIPEMKARIRASLRGGRLATKLWALTGVTGVVIFENDTDIPDPVHNATHWVEAMVVGGDATEIANVIYSEVTSTGVTKLGNTSAAETLSGTGLMMNFSRPVQVPHYVVVRITAGEGFNPPDPGALCDAIQNAIIAWGNANHDPGEDVSTEEIRAEVLKSITGKVVLEVEVEAVDPPTITTIAPVADRDQATFGTHDVNVSINP